MKLTNTRAIKSHTLWTVAFALAAGSALFNTGCAGCANTWKEFHASTTGLHKKITLYSNTGQVLREWTTTTDTDDKGGSCMFLDKDGKYVRIAGTFVVEEIQP